MCSFCFFIYAENNATLADDSEGEYPESGDTFYDESKIFQDEDDHRQGGYFGYTTKGDTFFMQYKTPRRDSKNGIFMVMEGQKNLFPVIKEEEEEADEPDDQNPSESDTESASISESDSESSASDECHLSDEKVLARSSPNIVKRVLIDINSDTKALLYLPQTFFGKFTLLCHFLILIES